MSSLRQYRTDGDEVIALRKEDRNIKDLLQARSARVLKLRSGSTLIYALPFNRRVLGDLAPDELEDLAQDLMLNLPRNLVLHGDKAGEHSHELLETIDDILTHYEVYYNFVDSLPEEFYRLWQKGDAEIEYPDKNGRISLVKKTTILFGGSESDNNKNDAPVPESSTTRRVNKQDPRQPIFSKPTPSHNTVPESTRPTTQRVPAAHRRNQGRSSVGEQRQVRPENAQEQASRPNQANPSFVSVGRPESLLSILRSEENVPNCPVLEQPGTKPYNFRGVLFKSFDHFTKIMDALTDEEYEMLLDDKIQMKALADWKYEFVKDGTIWKVVASDKLKEAPVKGATVVAQKKDGHYAYRATETGLRLLGILRNAEQEAATPTQPKSKQPPPKPSAEPQVELIDCHRSFFPSEAECEKFCSKLSKHEIVALNQGILRLGRNSDGYFVETNKGTTPYYIYLNALHDAGIPYDEEALRNYFKWLRVEETGFDDPSFRSGPLEP